MNDSIKQNKEKEICLEARILRDGKTGEIMVSVKSPKNWSAIYDKSQRTIVWAGIECYLPQTSGLFGLRSKFSPDYHDMWYNDYPNLMVLLAKDINNGVTFKFGAFPVAQERMEDWARLLKEEAKIIFLSYLKPFDIIVKITCETIENEIHY